MDNFLEAETLLNLLNFMIYPRDLSNLFVNQVKNTTFMKIKSSLFLLLALTPVLFKIQPSSAQSQRSSNTASLAEMSCKNIGGKFRVKNEDIVIGRRVYTGILEVSDSGDPYTWNQAIAITCALASNGSQPRFRTLNLAFGIADDHPYSVGKTEIRMKLFRDGGFYESVNIRQGDSIRAAINVENIRSFSFELECLNGRPALGGGEGYCPPVWFTEDLLTE